MAVFRDELNRYLTERLLINNFKDYGPNGLQIEGKTQISKIAFGVTASLALIEAAIEAKADAIIVHHGLFWQGDPFPIVGMKKKRIEALLKNNINLYAFHLPLDCHLTLGNNAQIAKLLELTDVKTYSASQVENLLWMGRLKHKKTVSAFKDHCRDSFQRAPLYLGNDETQLIETVAWCSGGAQKYIENAKHLGADLYLSGEVSEQTMHYAQEENIHYLSCGHHATERYGVQALSHEISNEFSVECEYIDINNPV